MHCPRCKGFMVTNRLEELWSSDTVNGWRCLLCGENIDPVIQVNRTRHVRRVRSRARVPGAPTAKSAKGKARQW
jgi:hypothetical protein